MTLDRQAHLAGQSVGGRGSVGEKKKHVKKHGKERLEVKNKLQLHMLGVVQQYPKRIVYFQYQ